MTWTTTPPKETGDYRWRESDQNDYVLVRLFTAEGKLVGFDARESWPFSKPVLEFGGEWCGPLVEAEEVKAAWDERDAALAALAEHERGDAMLCAELGSPTIAEGIAALREWKEAAMQLESSWSIQRVGDLLNVPLGESICPRIEPGIQALQAEVADLRQQTSGANFRLVSADDLERMQAEIAELRRHLSPPCDTDFPAASQLKALGDEQSYQRPLPDGSNGGI